MHVFDIGLLERAVGSLPFHYAYKKVPFVEVKSGERVMPDEENAIKFERFIFDLLPLAKSAVVVEVDAFNHHAVLKNATGSNSPETVKRNISALHAAWLRQAGAVVLDGAPIRISSLFADSPEIVIDEVAMSFRKIAPHTHTMII